MILADCEICFSAQTIRGVSGSSRSKLIKIYFPPPRNLKKRKKKEIYVFFTFPTHNGTYCNPRVFMCVREHDRFLMVFSMELLFGLLWQELIRFSYKTADGSGLVI